MIVTVLKVPENNTSVAVPAPTPILTGLDKLPPGSIHLEMDWLWFMQPGFQNCYGLASHTGLPLCIYCCITSYSKVWWHQPTHISLLSFCGSALQVQLRWVPLTEENLSWSCSQGVSWGCNFVSKLGSGWKERRVGRSSTKVTHMVVVFLSLSLLIQSL